MMIYIAMREDSHKRSEVLGAFSREEIAVLHCMKQPTYTYQNWIRDEKFDRWHNGHGLYIKVVKYELR